VQRQLIQSEKLASLGLLISGIAHEINNPSNFITLNIPVMRDYMNAIMPIVNDYVKDHQDFELFGMSYSEFHEDISGSWTTLNMALQGLLPSYPT
jgi:two-component system NtrC family sensor kinase